MGNSASGLSRRTRRTYLQIVKNCVTKRGCGVVNGQPWTQGLDLALAAQRGSDGCPGVRRNRPAALSVPSCRSPGPPTAHAQRSVPPPRPPEGPATSERSRKGRAGVPRALLPSHPYHRRKARRFPLASVPSAHSPAFSSVTLAIFQLLPVSHVCRAYARRGGVVSNQ